MPGIESCVGTPGSPPRAACTAQWDICPLPACARKPQQPALRLPNPFLPALSRAADSPVKVSVECGSSLDEAEADCAPLARPRAHPVDQRLARREARAQPAPGNEGENHAPRTAIGSVAERWLPHPDGRRGKIGDGHGGCGFKRPPDYLGGESLVARLDAKGGTVSPVNFGTDKLDELVVPPPGDSERGSGGESGVDCFLPRERLDQQSRHGRGGDLALQRITRRKLAHLRASGLLDSAEADHADGGDAPDGTKAHLPLRFARAVQLAAKGVLQRVGKLGGALSPVHRNIHEAPEARGRERGQQLANLGGADATLAHHAL
eukprot:scaffold24723_cov131-Isochrysis_galbana.AAC.1